MMGTLHKDALFESSGRPKNHQYPSSVYYLLVFFSPLRHILSTINHLTIIFVVKAFSRCQSVFILSVPFLCARTNCKRTIFFL